MDGKNVVNIIYNNIYISPNNVSQNWLTLIMLLHSYIIYIGLMSTLFPLPFLFKKTFPLFPTQKRKKGVARLPVEILFRNLRSPLVAWLEKVYETKLRNTQMQALYVSEICVACWGMQSPANATSLQLLVSWRNYFYHNWSASSARSLHRVITTLQSLNSWIHRK